MVGAAVAAEQVLKREAVDGSGEERGVRQPESARAAALCEVESGQRDRGDDDAVGDRRDELKERARRESPENREETGGGGVGGNRRQKQLVRELHRGPKEQDHHDVGDHGDAQHGLRERPVGLERGDDRDRRRGRSGHTRGGQRAGAVPRGAMAAGARCERTHLQIAMTAAKRETMNRRRRSGGLPESPARREGQ